MAKKINSIILVIIIIASLWIIGGNIAIMNQTRYIWYNPESKDFHVFAIVAGIVTVISALFAKNKDSGWALYAIALISTCISTVIAMGCHYLEDGKIELCLLIFGAVLIVGLLPIVIRHFSLKAGAYIAIAMMTLPAKANTYIYGNSNVIDGECYVVYQYPDGSLWIKQSTQVGAVGAVDIYKDNYKDIAAKHVLDRNYNLGYVFFDEYYIDGIKWVVYKSVLRYGDLFVISSDGKYLRRNDKNFEILRFVHN